MKTDEICSSMNKSIKSFTPLSWTTKNNSGSQETYELRVSKTQSKSTRNQSNYEFIVQPYYLTLTGKYWPKKNKKEGEDYSDKIAYFPTSMRCLFHFWSIIIIHRSTPQHLKKIGYFIRSFLYYSISAFCKPQIKISMHSMRENT